ncbi:hypothetical protein BTVI_65645 [Pitangus sulphuratus]|nr:hypothetical protein BTVI_65645 [Pitangus sulphuratus]
MDGNSLISTTALIVQQESYGVVTIMETWWDDSHDWSAAMDGYKLFRRDRNETLHDVMISVYHITSFPKLFRPEEDSIL